MDKEDRQMLQEVHGWTKDLKEMVYDHHRWINGHNGTPGAKVRIDRLEQSNLRQKALQALIAVPLIGGAVTWLINTFGK